VLAQLSRKGAVLSRMTARSVGACTHPWLLHEVVDIGVLHVERRDARVTALHYLERFIDRRKIVRFRRLIQCLATQAGGGTGITLSGNQQGGRSAAPAQIVLHVGDEPRVRRGVRDTREQRVTSSFFGPARQK